MGAELRPSLRDELREQHWPWQAPFVPYGDPLAAPVPPDVKRRRAQKSAMARRESHAAWLAANPEPDFARLLKAA